MKARGYWSKSSKECLQITVVRRGLTIPEEKENEKKGP